MYILALKLLFYNHETFVFSKLHISNYIFDIIKIYFHFFQKKA